MNNNNKRISKDCKKQFTHSPSQTFVIILAILGLSNILALIFMTIYFSFEQLGVTPFLSLIYLDNIPEGDNWILFLTSILLAFFLGLLLIYGFIRIYQQKSCEHHSSLNKDINDL